ncbi:DUF411 domain-containing protein [Castellaniella defragrans]|uniref:DUF411 domain-containing protein n=1 Tax=Castellaniella defragrans TaxID=75697 RepID=A0A7W9TRQ2_CASDE|nr:DUF411 domain-containing protein [Castellaniella defragrans]KAB0606548.1 DUF411 domain-containing protein [Castellaniella defragrans]MBB6085484.1 hypothetical protein [Castellaniella defragrans]
MHAVKKLALGLALGLPLSVFAASIPVKMYKNPNCGCCDRWAAHMEANGFTVETVNTSDLAAIKAKYDIPANLAGCHTALIDGYVVEGLVPAKYVKQMLSEHMVGQGLSLPGMPVGAPGMPGEKTTALTVYTLGPGTAPQAYASF